MCDTGFHVSVQVKALEDYVTKKVKARLFRLDVSEIDNADSEALRTVARREVGELQERLDGFTREGAMGKLSPQRLGAIERELEPLIADAQRRARTPTGKTLLYKLIENPYLWDDMTMKQRREQLVDLFDIHIDLIGRGKRNYDIAQRIRLTRPGTDIAITD